jgi:predicted  nucleic acid-binding Zn-ribbon protein
MMAALMADRRAAEARAESLEHIVTQMQDRITAQSVELTEVRERAARLDGEVSGLRTALAVAEQQVATERRDAVESRANLERLRGRGFLARLLNREK